MTANEREATVADWGNFGVTVLFFSLLLFLSSEVVAALSLQLLLLSPLLLSSLLMHSFDAWLRVCSLFCHAVGVSMLLLSLFTFFCLWLQRFQLSPTPRHCFQLRIAVTLTIMINENSNHGHTSSQTISKEQS